MTTRTILVTGGNTGIGLALCRQLLVDHGCNVIMGSRSMERGAQGMKTITDAHPDRAESICKEVPGSDRTIATLSDH